MGTFATKALKAQVHVYYTGMFGTSWVHALIILEPIYGTKAILFGTHFCYIKTNDASVPV